MPGTISDNIYAQCVPAMSIDGSLKNGFSLTSIEATTKDDIANIFRQDDRGDNIWRIITTLLEADFQGKACAQKINGMAEFLKGRARVLDPKRLTVSKISQNRHKVFPFVEMRVKNPINNKRWWVSAGEAAGSGETTPNTSEAFDWKVIVESPTNIPIDVRWFPARGTVTIHGRSAGGVEQVPIYKVLDAEVSGTDLILYLDNISNNSADPFYANSATRRANVVTGILTRGVPNVTRMESHCPEIPALNTNQNKIFWLQESRVTFTEDSYVKMFKEMIRDNNPMYREFINVESVEALRQTKEDYDEQMALSFLRNPALASQTKNTYDLLEKVSIYAGDANSNTTTFSGYYDTYRAQALGMAEQLIDCEDADGVPCYVDMLGEKMDLQTLKQRLYRMLQIRRDQGSDTKTVQIWVHSRYREEMVDTFVTYFKAKGQDTTRINSNMSELANVAYGFTLRKIQLDWPSVTLELVSHSSLDDLIDDFTAKGTNDADATFKYAGNFMLIPDWNTIYRAVFMAGKSDRRSGTTAELAMTDSAFLCVAGEVPTRKVSHFWELWSTIVECPQASRLFTNFDDSEFLLAPAGS